MKWFQVAIPSTSSFHTVQAEEWSTDRAGTLTFTDDSGDPVAGYARGTWSWVREKEPQRKEDE